MRPLALAVFLAALAFCTATLSVMSPVRRHHPAPPPRHKGTREGYSRLRAHRVTRASSMRKGARATIVDGIEGLP